MAESSISQLTYQVASRADLGLAITDTPEFNGVSSVGTVGFNSSPGSDIDTDLVTVSVTDAPKMFWDESEDAFSFTKGAEFAGTIIPSFAQTTAAAAVVKIGSYFKCHRIGSTSVVSVGQWS